MTWSLASGVLNWDSDTGPINRIRQNSGKVQVRINGGHSWANGDMVRITGTTNYNGIYYISGVSSNQFYIDGATYVANETVGSAAQAAPDFTGLQTSEFTSVVSTIISGTGTARKTVYLITARVKINGIIRLGEGEELIFGPSITRPDLFIASTGYLIIGPYPRPTTARIPNWCPITTTSASVGPGTDNNANTAMLLEGSYYQCGGLVNWRGEVRPQAASTLSINDCHWHGWGPQPGGDVHRIRQRTPDCEINNVKLTGMIRFDFYRASAIDGLITEHIPSAGIQCLAGFPESVNQDIFEFEGYDQDGLTFDCDAFSGARVRFKNLKRAIEILITHNARVSSSTFYAVSEVLHDVQFRYKDIDGNLLGHGIHYQRDTNNGNRPSGNPVPRWRLGSSGYLDDRINHGISAEGTGLGPNLTVLTRTIREGTSGNGNYGTRKSSWLGSLTSLVDYRSLNNSYDDIFAWHHWRYGFLYRRTLIAQVGPAKLVDVELLPDPNITETDRAVVAAYTMFTLTILGAVPIIGVNGTATLDQLYDWLQYVKSRSVADVVKPAIDMPIATRDGDKLVVGEYDVTIDGGTLNPGTKFKTIQTDRTYTEANGGTGNIGVISAAGTRLSITSNVAGRAAFKIGNTITHHNIPSKPTVATGSTVIILAKANGYIYQKYTLDTDASTSLEIRLPRDPSIDLDTAITHENEQKFTLRDETDSGLPVVPAGQLQICVGKIDLYAQRAKSKRYVDALFARDKALTFLLDYTSEIMDDPLDGAAFAFETDRIRMDTTKQSWHKTSLLLERSRVGVPVWTAGDVAYKAPRGDTGEVIFDGLSTIADVDPATLAAVVSATSQDMTVTEAIAQRVWSELDNNITTPNSIGKALVDFIIDWAVFRSETVSTSITAQNITDIRDAIFAKLIDGTRFDDLIEHIDDDIATLDDLMAHHITTAMESAQVGYFEIDNVPIAGGGLADHLVDATSAAQYPHQLYVIQRAPELDGTVYKPRYTLYDSGGLVLDHDTLEPSSAWAWRLLDYTINGTAHDADYLYLSVSVSGAHYIARIPWDATDASLSYAQQTVNTAITGIAINGDDIVCLRVAPGNIRLLSIPKNLSTNTFTNRSNILVVSGGGLGDAGVEITGTGTSQLITVIAHDRIITYPTSYQDDPESNEPLGYTASKIVWWHDHIWTIRKNNATSWYLQPLDQNYGQIVRQYTDNLIRNTPAKVWSFPYNDAGHVSNTIGAAIESMLLDRALLRVDAGRQSDAKLDALNTLAARAGFSGMGTDADPYLIKADAEVDHADFTGTNAKIDAVQTAVNAIPTHTLQQISDAVSALADYDEDSETTTSLKTTLIGLAQDVNIIEQLLSVNQYQSVDTIYKQVKDAHTILKKFGFNSANDVKATLDGETVTTDAASRTASKATGYATPANVTAAKDAIITDITDAESTITGVITSHDTDIDSGISGLDGKIDAVKGVVDAIPTTEPATPANVSTAETNIKAAITTAHGTTDGKIDTVDTIADDIKAELTSDEVDDGTGTNTNRETVKKVIDDIEGKVDTTVSQTTASAISDAVETAFLDDDDGRQFLQQILDKVEQAIEEESLTENALASAIRREVWQHIINPDDAEADQVNAQTALDTARVQIDRIDTDLPTPVITALINAINWLVQVGKADFIQDNEYQVLQDRDTKEEIIRFENRGPANINWGAGRKKPTVGET